MRSEQLEELRPSRPITTPTDRIRQTSHAGRTTVTITSSHGEHARARGQLLRSLAQREKAGDAGESGATVAAGRVFVRAEIF
jgi:hypothetical protein